MKKWTKERIAALAPRDRARLYANARKLGTTEGAALVCLVEDVGLPLSDGGSVKGDDSLVLAMEAIVQSPEGRAGCIEAVENGWPAIAGVDPMLADALGVDYGKHNMTTHWAGHLVADLPRSLGYRMFGKMGATPKGCVARSGELWTK